MKMYFDKDINNVCALLEQILVYLKSIDDRLFSIELSLTIINGNNI